MFPASSNQELIFNPNTENKDRMLDKFDVTDFYGIKRWKNDRD